MLIVFEMHVRPDFDETKLFDDEAREALQARVMTPAEAAEAGLVLPEPKRAGDVRYLPVNARHRGWVERRCVSGRGRVRRARRRRLSGQAPPPTRARP